MRTLGLLVAAGIVIGAGLVHGSWTNRWRPNLELRRMMERLDAVPTRIGTWTGEDVPLDARELEGAGAMDALSRRYVDSETGESVSVFVVVGAPGDIAVHTPDVCYPGAGFVLGPIGKTELPINGTAAASKADFFTATASRARPDRLERIRLLWAWTLDGTWAAPSDARGTYLHAPALCKLYLVSQDGLEPDSETNPRLAFFGQFLDAVNKAMFTPARSS